jgi:hypothetical protein
VLSFQGRPRNTGAGDLDLDCRRVETLRSES